jgi:hypothetical protein
MKFHILKSPKTKLRSSPIAEKDKARLAPLLEKGWKIVETLDDSPVEVAAKKKAAKTTNESEL